MEVKIDRGRDIRGDGNTLDFAGDIGYRNAFTVTSEQMNT